MVVVSWYTPRGGGIGGVSDEVAAIGDTVVLVVLVPLLAEAASAESAIRLRP